VTRALERLRAQRALAARRQPALVVRLDGWCVLDAEGHPVAVAEDYETVCRKARDAGYEPRDLGGHLKPPAPPT